MKRIITKFGLYFNISCFKSELAKVKDESGKLVKKIGNMGKAVVIYEPLAKIRQTLQRSGLTEFIKNDQPTQGTALKTESVESNCA